MFELRQLFNLRKTLGKDELQISQDKVVRIELGMKPIVCMLAIYL